MPSATVRAGTNAWVNSGLPAKKYGANPATMQLSTGASGSATRYGYLSVRNPVPHGGTPSAATLTLYVKAATGTKNVSAECCANGWKASSLTWNNRPSASGATATTAIGTVTDATPVVIDVTALVATWAPASVNTIRLSQDAAAVLTAYGYDSAHPPTLAVTWTDAPATPTNLRPGGGVVGLSKFVTTWDYSDLDGDALAKVEVQLDPTGNWAAPVFDSGWVSATVPELDLSTTAYGGLAASATTQWRCRVQDDTGASSSWSDAVSVTYKPKSALTITSPSAASPVVHDNTPPIVWTFAGTQVSYRVQILDATYTIVADSGWVGGTAGTDQQWTVPGGILNDTDTFTARVRVRDDQDRVTSPGDATYTQAEQTFTFAEGTGVAAPTGVTVTQAGLWPAATLAWSAATAPDYFTVYRDGKVLVADLEPGDCVTQTGTYSYIDNTAKVGVDHTYTLRAVVNHQSSPLTAGVDITLILSGIFLSDPVSGGWFVLSGQDTSGWAMTDDVTVYSPLGSSTKMQVTQGQYGIAGSVTGTLYQRPGHTRTVPDMESDLFAMKQYPERTLRLALGDTNIPVKVSNLSCVPAPDSSTGNLRRTVSFDFFQCGEYPFKTRL